MASGYTKPMRGRREVRDAQRSFSGGLNLTSTPEQMAQNEVRRLENGHIDNRGGLVKRGGTERWLSSAIPGSIQNGFGWDSTQVVVSGGRVFLQAYVNANTDTPGTSVEVGAGTLSQTAIPSMAVFREAGGGVVTYIADGGPLNKVASVISLTEDIAGTPDVSFIWVYNNRLFGVSGTSTLYWSALDNGDTLGNAGAGGGAAVLQAFGIGEILAGVALGASNMLVHRVGVSRFTGWTIDDINIQAGAQGLSPNVGTVSARSLVVDGQVGYFAATNGFYRFTESTIEQIGDRVASVISDIPTGVSVFLYDPICAMHNKYKNEIMWRIPGFGILAYNYRLDAWVGPHTGIFTGVFPALTSMWTGRDFFGRDAMFTGWSDGHVRVFERVKNAPHFTDDADYGGANGVDYDLAAPLRRMYFRSPTRQKTPRRAWVHYRPSGSSNCTLTWATRHGSGSKVLSDDAHDNALAWGASGSTWGQSGPWGGITEEISMVPIDGRGEYVDFTLRCKDNAPARFSMIEAQAFDLGERAV